MTVSREYPLEDEVDVLRRYRGPSNAARVNPGRAEVLDNDVDENCDGSVTCFADADAEVLPVRHAQDQRIGRGQGVPFGEADAVLAQRVLGCRERVVDGAKPVDVSIIFGGREDAREIAQWIVERGTVAQCAQQLGIVQVPGQ